MGPPVIIEAAKGPVNGVNLIFSTSSLYKVGSVVVFMNGVSKRADYSDGWTELGSRKIQMKIAPQVGDVLQIYYSPC